VRRLGRKGASWPQTGWTRIDHPVAFDEVEKRLDEIGASPATRRLFPQHLSCAIEPQRGLVGSLGHQRIEHVHDTDNPCEQRNRVTTQSVRVAASVHAFVMMPNDRAHQSQRAESGAEAVADHCVVLDERSLTRREGAPLLQHAARDANLPDIVKIAASVQRCDLLLAEPDRSAERAGVPREPLAVVGGSGIAGLDLQCEAHDHCIGAIYAGDGSLERKDLRHGKATVDMVGDQQDIAHRNSFREN
jgi:hypothetical protein